MPFDSVITRCTVKELNKILLGGRIEKIQMPVLDEVIMTIRSMGKNHRLLISANSESGRLQLTGDQRDFPQIPPNFCMLLRKHITAARITDIIQSGYERVVTFVLETTTELGDSAVRKLIVEIMGKHSNIILVNSSNVILDAVKHVDASNNTYREVLPARHYVAPPATDKMAPEEFSIDNMLEHWQQIPENSLYDILITSAAGVSPNISRDICTRSGISPETTYEKFLQTADYADKLQNTAVSVFDNIVNENYKPYIVHGTADGKKIIDYHCIPLVSYPAVEECASISEAMGLFYSDKEKASRLKQNKANCRRVLKNALDRCRKKIALQENVIGESAEREKFKLYGDILTANLYRLEQGAESVKLPNYYDERGGDITVKLDVNLTPAKNAQKYYKQYAKARNAFTNTTEILKQSLKEFEYLEETAFLLEQCDTREAIAEIEEELIEGGYIKKHGVKGKKNVKNKESMPYRYVSSDGCDIYIGRNNRQNDMLTFKMASSNDIWLHTRNIPGSHTVIRKSQGDISEKTIFEAALLAAWYSKAKNASKVPVEYTQIRYVKKAGTGKPGMVIYDNFSTILVDPTEEAVGSITRVK